MSGRKKRKIKNRLASRVLSGKASPAEARRALVTAGVPVKGQKAAPAAAKSASAPRSAAAGADTIYKTYRAGLTPQQRNYLEVYDLHSSPAVREAAFRAAFAEKRTS